jgi:nicotinamidase-related amidase
MRMFDANATGLLLVDPYNDFLSNDGKLNSFAKPIADEVNMLANMRDIVTTCRQRKIQIFYVPHHRARPDDFDGWQQATPYQLAGHKVQAFAVDSWGGEWHADFLPRPGDIIVKEHWSSGFAGTDLDLQLRQHGIRHVVLIGMLANTCLEARGRYGMDLGYRVTLVKDATAAFSREAMHAAHEINGPTYAHSILDTAELLGAISKT